MKILVVIANYGTKNDIYLSKVLDAYRELKDDVDIIVTSNLVKDFGKDVDVVVGMPTKDPWSLGFAHKRIFADRINRYDLFIYTEDDVLITRRNIDAFLRATEILPEDELASFFLYETGQEGKKYFPQARQHYRWDPESVSKRGEDTFAFHSNLHAACYMLTREQLGRAINSGGYLVEPHEGKYDLLVAAATDPYTQCGFKKMVCISRFDDFLLPHLPNKYWRMGVLSEDDFYDQLKVLRSIGRNGKLTTALFPIETNLYHMHWSKDFYEPCQHKLINLVPQSVKSVLSVGCGWGATEKALIEKGIRVRGLPIDSVVSVNAQRRGVEIVNGDLATARVKLQGQLFDCVLLSNVLHLVRDPVALLSSFAEFLAPGGCIVASVPNLSWFRRASRSIRLRGLKANPISYEVSGMHVTNGRLLKDWFRDAGLQPLQVIYEVSEEKKRADAQTLGLAKPLLASNVYLSGTPVRMGPK
jgi:2-polyprenyl-3-methyl-5-hydroxy-6-metoxy-1,4-benzoquinol methylase